MLGVMGIWQSNEQSATDDESVCGDLRFPQIPSRLTPFPGGFVSGVLNSRFFF